MPLVSVEEAAAATGRTRSVTAGQWTLVACDGSGNALAELTRAAGVNLTFTRNGVPECQFSLSHDDDECAVILDALTAGTGGGMPTVKGYRTDGTGTKVLRFNGYLAAVSDESGADASTATFTFKGPFGRLLGDGSSRGRYTGSVVFSATDAGTIAKSLIDTTNLLGATGVVTSAATIEATKVRDRVYRYANVGGAIIALTSVLDGFDFEVLPLDSLSIAPLPAPTNLVVIDSGDPGPTYYYRVTALDAHGETTGSNEAGPVGRFATIQWSPVTNAVAYRVYRATVSGGESSSPALVRQTTATLFTDLDTAPTTGAVPATNTTGGPSEDIGLFAVYARQGQDRPAAKFEHGQGTLRNCSTAHRQVLPPINRVLGLGDNGLSSLKEDSASQAKYGLFEYSFTATGVAEQATLDDKATAYLRPDPVKVFDFTPDPRLAPLPFDDYWIGDTVYCYVSRGALIEGPTAVRVNQVRIVVDPDTGYEAAEIPDPVTPGEERTIRASLQTEVVE